MYLNNLDSKEEVEWSNFWYDQANKPYNKRVLLIGDSIARGARRSLSQRMGCPVDLFGTSAALRDQMFWDQLDCFFKSGLYTYNVIVIWHGNHSRMSEDGSSYYTDSDYIKFKKDFLFLLTRINSLNIKGCKLLILSTLYLYEWRKKVWFLEKLRHMFMFKPKEIQRLDDNAVIDKKNMIMHSVADSLKINFFDINKELIESKYWHVDHVHYIQEASPFIAELIERALMW